MALRRCIEAHGHAVLRAWGEGLRQPGLPGPSDAFAPAEAGAELLQLIADMLRAGGSSAADADGEVQARRDSACRHGRACQRQGTTSTELVTQFAVLRSVVLRLWHAQAPNGVDALGQALAFDAAVDQALGWALEGHSQAASQTRDTFLAVVGHDLRSPLGSLAGCLELLEKPTLPWQRRQRSAAIARRSVRTIQGMVTDLLEYTRSRLGQNLPVQSTPGDLAALCREAVEEAQAAYLRSSFTIEVPQSLPGAFDAFRMRQVLANLLNNAVHHGEPGTAITLAARAGNGSVAIEVRNLGEPIPAELLATIFDPLVQVPVATGEHRQRPATSLGLGLFIAREIVTAHGGRIDVTSTADVGTSFIVSLPWPVSSAHRPLRAAGDHADATTAPGTGPVTASMRQEDPGRVGAPRGGASSHAP